MDWALKASAGRSCGSSDSRRSVFGDHPQRAPHDCLCRHQLRDCRGRREQVNRFESYFLFSSQIGKINKLLISCQ